MAINFLKRKDEDENIDDIMSKQRRNQGTLQPEEGRLQAVDGNS